MLRSTPKAESTIQDISHAEDFDKVKRVENLDDLADRYIRLVEEHRLLKEERNEQQEKIKQMTTKFMRVMTDLKKSGGSTAEDGIVLQKKGGRDKDAEAYIEMLQQQIKGLKKSNAALRAENTALEKRLERVQKAHMTHPSQYRSPSAPPRPPAPAPVRPPRMGPAPAKPRITQPSVLQPPTSPASYIDRHRRSALHPAKDGPTLMIDAASQTAAVTTSLSTSSTQTPSFDLLVQQYTRLQPPVNNFVDKAVQCVNNSHEDRQGGIWLGDGFLAGDTQQQKEYMDRLHSLVDALRQKLEESQEVMQKMRQDMAAMTKERDDAIQKYDSLLSRRTEEEQGKMSDIVALQREVKEKNAKLVLLHTRFQQAEGQILGFKETNTSILAEMKHLNQQLVDERKKVLELERQLQLARLSEDRHQDYTLLLDDLRAEKRAVEEENSRLVQQLLQQQSSVEGELRQEYEDQIKGLEASIFKWETASKRQFQDYKLMESKYDTVSAELKAMREAKAKLEAQVVKLQSEHQVMVEKFQMMAALQGEEHSEDLDKALAIVRTARLRGQPTELEFLLPAFDKETGGRLELDHMRAENANLLRDLATSHKFVEVLRQRIEDIQQREKERIQQLQDSLALVRSQVKESKAYDAKVIRSQLEKILHLEANVTTMKQQLGTRLSIDGGLVPLKSLASEENLIEVYIGHLRLEASFFTTDVVACPPPVFVAIDFLDHLTQMTEVIADLSPVFDNTYMYTVQMNEFLLYYLQNKTLDFELNRSHGADYVTIATASIPLFDLLQPPGVLRGFALLLSSSRDKVGQLEYTITVKKPLPSHWLVQYHDSQRMHVGRQALTLDEEAADAMYHRLTDVASITINIIACNDLKVLASNASELPHCIPYVHYNFFHHPDVTIEQPSADMRTLSPVFHHAQTYPCVFTVPFLSYICFGSLPLVVFNDLEEDEEKYIGMVLVPLKALLDGPDAKVSGPFELKDPSGQPSGTISLSIWWNSKETLTLDAELAMSQLGGLE